MWRRVGFVSISEQDWEVNEKVKMTLTFKSQDNFNKRAFFNNTFIYRKSMARNTKKRRYPHG